MNLPFKTFSSFRFSRSYSLRSKRRKVHYSRGRAGLHFSTIYNDKVQCFSYRFTNDYLNSTYFKQEQSNSFNEKHYLP